MKEIDKIEKEIQALNKERQDLQTKYQTKMQEHLKGLTKAFFKDNPQVTAFVWTQYTPYFNDGDECTFRRNEISVTNCPLDEIDDVRYDEYEGETENVFVSNFSDWFMKSDYYKDERQKITDSGVDIKAVQQFVKLLDSIDEDVYLETFGNHVRVVATAQGFDIEEYDHD